MVPVLNHVNTACAVYGNHDFGKYYLAHIFLRIIKTAIIRNFFTSLIRLWRGLLG